MRTVEDVSTICSAELYQREIHKVPLLTEKEEQKLAALAEAGNEAARRALVNANLRLVVYIVRKDYKGMETHFSDLIQEGNIGLLRAAEKFNPDMGYRFSTYACWWIKHAISKAIEEQVKTIRIPRRVHMMLREVKKADAQLFKELGRVARDEEIAARLKVSVGRIVELRRAEQSVESLDVPVSDEDDTSYADTLEDTGHLNPEADVLARSLREELEKALSSLPEREQTVVRWLYGFADGKPHTLAEVGELLGVTRERVRQINARVLRKLRDILA